MPKFDSREANLHPVHLYRRRLIQNFVLGSSLIVFNSLPANAFKLKVPGLGSSGGGANWGTIVKDFAAGLKIIAKGSIILGLVLADLAEALGLKQQAALMRGQVENLKKKGDSFGGSDMEEFGKVSTETAEVVKDKLKEAKELSAEQKAKMAEGLKKQVSAVSLGITGLVKIVSAAGSISGAGAPGFADGLEAAKAATTIPETLPKAISFMEKQVEVTEQLAAIAREKNIAVPDTSNMSDAMSKMG